MRSPRLNSVHQTYVAQLSIVYSHMFAMDCAPGSLVSALLLGGSDVSGDESRDEELVHSLPPQ